MDALPLMTTVTSALANSISTIRYNIYYVYIDTYTDRDQGYI